MEKHPLRHWRILDFGTAWAGPMSGAYLSDMGAEVIKIESKSHIDPLRHGPGPIMPGMSASAKPEPIPETNSWFHMVNRGKLDISLDFTHPKGKELFLELVSVSDAVIDNFTPDVLPGNDLGYDVLKGVRPDLVMVGMSVAGSSGSKRDTRAYANTITALSGIEWLQGYSDTTTPMSLSGAYGDFNSAHHSAVATLLALYHRERTGQGQFVDLSQWEIGFSLLGEASTDYLLNHRVMRPRGNAHPLMVPHDHYPCKGEDQWVSIAVATHEEWRALCRAMGQPSLAEDPRFADRFSRRRNLVALDKIIAEWTRKHTPYEATDLLQKAGVAAAPLVNMEERAQEPHFNARGLYQMVEHPRVGKENLANIPWRFSETPGGIKGSAPLFAQHNDYVFRTLLGLSPHEIARLEEEKVL